MNTKIISSALLALALCTPLGVWADGGINPENQSTAAGNVQEEYLLLNVETLDKVVGYAEVDEEGHQNKYLRRNLDGVVDRFTEHTDEAVHNQGEDYQYWREYLGRPHPSVETLKYFFAKAAQEFGVPVDILQAIGQVENNWTQIGPSIDQGWGIMHLVQNNYADTLTEAANLLGVSQQVLKDEARQNIRGAAALLAKYAGNQRDSFTKLEDWFDAVKQFSGLINDELREMLAKRYYDVMKTGVVSSTLWGETIGLEPHPEINISSRAIRRNTRSADYDPAVSDLTPCNHKVGRDHVIDTWVNHWIGGGTVESALSKFFNCTNQVSAHFIVRTSGEIIQVVSVDNTAWHAGANGYPYNNDRSIGVEHEVTLTNPNSWTEPMLRASADMARYFADRYQIPKTRPAVKADEPGIRGHNDMPGTNTRCLETFPWDTWMSYFSGGGNSGNISNFDGAGSLIAPSSCTRAGCNWDEARMHHHDDNSGPSTVVFQWFYDSDYCDHIDISTEPDIGEVIVQSRLWEEHLNGMAYRGRLPLSVPKAQGLKPSRWNITAITSTVPITNELRVFAECSKQSSLTDSYYGKTELDPNELVGFDFGYYWTGNGSLMSFAGTETGMTYDIAVTFNSHKSLTVFQWYASDSCPGVTISNKNGSTVMLNGVENGVSIKVWYEKGWEKPPIPCNGILPCTVTASKQNEYYLIKIKTDANAVLGGELEATCF